MIFKFKSNNLEPTFRKITDYVKDKDDFFVIEIQKSKRVRSLNQNKYYFGVVIKILSEHTGYTSDETHQVLAGMFLKYQNNGKTFVKSTAKLNTFDFEQYLDKIRQWAREEMSAYIPMPNEITEEVYMTLNNIFERE